MLRRRADIIKLGLLLSSLLLGWRAAAERFGSLGLSPSFMMYVGLFGVLLITLLASAFVRPAALRWTYALLFGISAFFLDSFERITGDHLTYDGFINMVNSFGFAGDAVRQHGTPMLWSLLVSALLFAAIALKPGRIGRLPPLLGACLPLAGIGLLSAILFARGGEGARGLPAAVTPLAYSALLLYEAGTGDWGPRQEVRLVPSTPAAAGDVILIMEESVGGHYLDINSPVGVRSGLKEPPAGLAIHNFGHAASITNCSVGTNVTLRYGGTRADYRRINATMPSIWSYAKRAGFGTAYVDGQRTGGQLHNLMTPDELKQIDRFIQFDEVKVRDRDRAASDALAALLANGRPDFVIVNKVGAHFPVHDKFPDSFMQFRPVLPRGGHEDVSDTGSRKGFGGEDEDWLRYRNSYRNTLTWNVGAFFDRLFARGDLSHATIIYTSDHGQDLHERGNPGRTTHCSTDPVIEEGIVPLVVIQGSRAKGLDWTRHLAANRDRQSHYAIFPTLLALMGYARQNVLPTYGAALDEPSQDPFTFNTRFNARLGGEPHWTSIDVKKIALPPESLPRSALESR